MPKKWVQHYIPFSPINVCVFPIPKNCFREKIQTYPLLIEGDHGQGEKYFFCMIDYWFQEIFIFVFVFVFIKRKLVSLRSVRR